MRRRPRLYLAWRHPTYMFTLVDVLMNVLDWFAIRGHEWAIRLWTHIAEYTWEVAALSAKWRFVQHGGEHMSHEEFDWLMDDLTFLEFTMLMSLREPGKDDVDENYEEDDDEDRREQAEHKAKVEREATKNALGVDDL